MLLYNLPFLIKLKMRDFPESWAPRNPPPLLLGLVMNWRTEDFMRISGVVSLSVCSLAVGGGAQHFFLQKKGAEVQKGWKPLS